MKKIKEEIGRNYHTIDTDPYTWEDFSKVDYNMYKSEDGHWHVKITSEDYPEHNQPLRKFADEASAKFYAQQMSDRIMRLTINEVRQLVRNLISEVSYHGCTQHSLGFIDDLGNFIDLNKTGHSHFTYLEELFPEIIAPPTPEGWIKVTNAYVLKYQKNDWSEISLSQINGLIDMWTACAKWGLLDPERKVYFYNMHEDNFTQSIGDFLEEYGSRRQVDRFYNFLLGE